MKKQYVIVITLIPVILLLSVGISLFLYVIDRDRKPAPVVSEVTAGEVQDSLEKLYEYVGPRSLQTEGGRKNLRSVTAMVKGALGQDNLNLELHRSRAETSKGLIWRSLWIDFGGEKDGKVNVLAVAQDDEGVSLAFALHFAEHEAGRWAGGPMKIVFYSPMIEKAGRSRIWDALDVPAEKRGRITVLKTGEPGEDGTEMPDADEGVVVLPRSADPAGFEQAESLLALFPEVEKKLR